MVKQPQTEDEWIAIVSPEVWDQLKQIFVNF
jgi:hypothetical protein